MLRVRYIGLAIGGSFTFLLLLLIVSCTSEKEKFIGQWQATDRPLQIEFFGDGSATFTALGVPLAATFKIVERKNFRMIVSGDQFLITGSISDAGNELSVNVMGAEVLFKRAG